MADSNKKKSRRPRPLPPHVTARNLAIEKRRREIFNGDILDLARLVPALGRVPRLSKARVLKESVRHFRRQRAVCISAARDVQILLDENRRLSNELGSLRQTLSDCPTQAPDPTAPSDAILELMNIENDVYVESPADSRGDWAPYNSQHQNVNNAIFSFNEHERSSTIQDMASPSDQMHGIRDPSRQFSLQSPSSYLHDQQILEPNSIFSWDTSMAPINDLNNVCLLDLFSPRLAAPVHEFSAYTERRNEEMRQPSFMLVDPIGSSRVDAHGLGESLIYSISEDGGFHDPESENLLFI